ncbi:uncharacterized protein LOC135467092 [Liolophura sinensis]|uniref:uncharacterized protein LOC135467092 n=1 Tax=Liolophura sinensis TaxID=3198878 RepID=UPI003159807B
MEGKMAADTGNLPLTRRQAIRRRGYNWKKDQSPCRVGSENRGQHTVRVERRRPRSVPATSARIPLGSSVDLTPSLLSMYDKITANGSQSTLHNGSHEDFPAEVSPEQNTNVKLLADEEKRLSETMDTTDASSGAGLKRPLSVGSTSSSSSASQPMQFRSKRPNLGEYDGTTTTATGGKPTLLALTDSHMGEISKDDLHVDVCEDWAGSQDPNHEDDHYYEHINFSEAAASLPIVKVYSPQSSTGSNDDVSLNSSTYSDDKGDNSPGCETVQSTYSLKLSNNNNSGAPSLGRTDSSSLTKVTDRNSNGSLNSPVLSRDSTYYVSYAQRVASEIVETEKTYVHSLKEILEGYMKHIKLCEDISQQDANKLFGNLKEIYEFNKSLLAELDDCGEDPVEVARCFVEKNEGFDIYTEYCTSYPASMEVLTKCMMQPTLAEKFKSWQAALGHGLPLGAYLLKPVQRILKYHLLLQNIVKHYESDLPGYDTLTTALGHMTHMAHHINEMKRRHEHAVRVQEVQSQLEDYADGPDLSTLGELVLEGSFRLLGAKASRSVFLFEKGILITKRKEEGTFSCKVVILCSNLMLVESIPKEPHSFHVIPFDNTKLQYTLQAHSIEMKRKWCQEIKRLILESYKGRIPDKVKSLVMGLGRTRAEEEELNNQGLSPDQGDKKRPRRKSANIMDLVKLKKAHRKLFFLFHFFQSDNTPPRLAPVNTPVQTAAVTSSGGRSLTRQSNKSLSGSRSMDNLSVSGSHTLPRSKLPSNGNGRESHSSDGREVGDTDSLASELTFADPNADPNMVRRAKSFKIATRMNPVRSIEINDHDESSGESMEVSTDEETLDDDVYVNLVCNNNNGDSAGAADDFSNLNYGARVTSMPSLNADVDEPDYVMVQLKPDQGVPVTSQSHLSALTHSETSKSAECLTGDGSSAQRSDLIYQNVECPKDNQLSVSRSSSYDNLNKRWSSSSITVEEEEEGIEEGSSPAVVPPPDEFADPVQVLSPEPKVPSPDPKLADPWVRQATSVVAETEVTKGDYSVSCSQKTRHHHPIGKSFSFPLCDADTACSMSKENFDWFVYSNRIASSLVKQFNKLQVLEKHDLSQRGSKAAVKYPGYVTAVGATDKYDLEQRKVIVQYGTPPRNAFTADKLNQYAALHKDCKASADKVSDKSLPESKKQSTKTQSSLYLPHAWKSKFKMDKSRDKSESTEDPQKMVEEMEKYAARHQPLKGHLSSTVKFPSNFASDFKQSHDKSGCLKLHADRSGANKSRSERNGNFKLLRERNGDFKLPSDRNGDSKLPSDRNGDFKLPSVRNGDFKLPSDRTGDFKLPSDRNNDFKFDRNSDSWSQKSRDSFSSGGNFMSRSRESLSSSTSSLNKFKSSQDSLSLQSASESESGPKTLRSKLSHLTSWLTARRQLPNINSYNPSRSMSTGQYQSAFNARYKPQALAEQKPSGFVSHLTKIYNSREQTSAPRTVMPKKVESSTPEKESNYAAVLRKRELGSPALGSRLAAFAGAAEPKVRSLPRQLTAPPNLNSDNETCSETTSVHSLDFAKERSPEPPYKIDFPSNTIQQSDSAVSIQSSVSATDTPLSPSSGRRSSCCSLDSSTDSIYERRFSRALEEPEDNVFRDSAVYSDMDSTSNYAVPPTALSPPRKSIREVVQQLEERARPKQPEVLDVRRREPGRTIQEKLRSLQESAQYHRRSQNFEEEIEGLSRPLREFHRSLGSSRSSVDREDPGFTIRYSRGYPGQEAGVKMTRSAGRLDQLDTDIPTLTTMKGWVRQLINKFQADQ